MTPGVDDFADLELSVQNMDHQIFPARRGPFMTCFEIEVYDATTNRVEKTELGQKRLVTLKEIELQLRGPRLIWVEPNRPHIERFRLSDYFKLTPGRFTLAVSALYPVPIDASTGRIETLKVTAPFSVAP